MKGESVIGVRRKDVVRLWDVVLRGCGVEVQGVGAGV